MANKKKLTLKDIKNKKTLIHLSKNKETIKDIFSELKKCGTPNNFSVEINDCGEKAYQRAIWLSERTKYKNITIEWVDIEIPVISTGPARRECADLIGKSGDTLVFVELKDKNGDSPLYAMYELIKYVKSIELYKNELLFHKNSRSEKLAIKNLNTIDRENLLLIVAAPLGYWQDYRRLKAMDSLYEMRKEIKELFDLYIEFAEFPDENFKKQKSAQGKYTPSLKAEGALEWHELK